MRPIAPPPSEEPLSERDEDWEPPVLAGEGKWIGCSLRREDIYGDDGR